MKVITTDSFTQSVKKLVRAKRWYRIEYWKERWWEFQWAIRNLKNYFKIVIETRDFDSIYILKMIKFQLGFLKERIRKGFEVIPDKCKKVHEIERVIELITNFEEDNFNTRCGYDENATKMEFVEIEPTESGEVMHEVVFVKQPGYEDYDSTQVTKDAMKLQEKEWGELMELLNNLRSWWE